MGKKHKHAPHENLERWVVSYADFMTLLFAVFTALFAIAKSEAGAKAEAIEEIRQGFNEKSLISGIKSIMQGKSSPSDTKSIVSQAKGEGDGVVGKFDNMTYTPGEVEGDQQALKKMAQELADSINQLAEGQATAGDQSPGTQKQAAQGEQGNDGKEAKTDKGTDKALEKASTKLESRGVRVSFDSRLFFHPGSAQLRPESLKAIKTVAERIKQLSKTHLIQIEGHTDNQPISGKFPSNWELSTARASTVVRALIGIHGFSSNHLAAVGYADSRPLADNKTPEGREKNRRIDIVIHTQWLTEQLDPGNDASAGTTDKTSADQTTTKPGEKSTTDKKTLTHPALGKGKPSGEGGPSETLPPETANVPQYLQPSSSRVKSQLVESAQTDPNSTDAPVRVIYVRKSGSTAPTPKTLTPITVVPPSTGHSKGH